jgi:exonuclease SbcC
MAELINLSGENFCCLKTFSIPLNNRGLVLITGSNEDTEAADNNGSGKTTIPKALTWGLFGETIDGDRYEEVIRWGEKETWVHVELRDGDHRWLVIRTRTKRKPKLELFYGDEHSTSLEHAYEGEPEEIQAKIIELVGLDFRGFCNTVLYGQGDRDRFFSSTDTVRKDTLRRVLRTDKYRKAEKWLRDKINHELAPRISELDSEVRTISARLSEYDLDSLESLANGWEKERDSRRERATEEMQQKLDAIAEAKAQVKAERERLSKQIKKVSEEIAEYKETKEDLNNATKDYNSKTDRLLKSKENVSKVTVERSAIAKELSRLDGDRCPVCTSPLDQGVAGDYVKSLQNKKADLDLALNKAQEMRQRSLRILQEAEETVSRIRDRVEEKGAAEGNLAGLRHQLEKLDVEARGAKAGLTMQAKSAMERVKQIDEEENPHVGRLEEAKKRVKSLKEEMKTKDAELSDANRDLNHHQFWVMGFGLKGLPSLLLDSTMPYLTTRANGYLETLSDSDISLSFSTQKQLKQKGELRDELSLDWIIEGVPGVRPSNGQRRKLEVATDLALMDLVASREGSLDLLMMDEVLDGLDAEGVSRVLNLLRGLRSRRSSIFVVTHEPNIAEAFEHVILVTKRKGASTVEVLS